MDQYQIYLSYRRNGGDILAAFLSDKLVSLGYKVWYDVTSLRAGSFTTQITDAIEQCEDVIVILSPEALDRCVFEDDWMRHELKLSISKGKNIIPVFLPGFDFPSSLPEDIKMLAHYNGVYYSPYHEEVFTKIVSFLACKKVEAKKKYQEDSPYCFVSYAHVDNKVVLPIIHAMQETGINIWYDNGIAAGSEWPEYIAEKVASCDRFVAFISNAYLESQNCKRELNFALSREKALLSVYIEDVKLSPGMEMQLGLYQALFRNRFTSERDFIAGLCQERFWETCVMESVD